MSQRNRKPRILRSSPASSPSIRGIGFSAIAVLFPGYEVVGQSWFPDTQVDASDTLYLLTGFSAAVIGVAVVVLLLLRHTYGNIIEEIAHAIAHDAVFHQFMRYTPVPAPPLHDQIQNEGRLLPGVESADIHGPYPFNFRHSAISAEDSKKFLDHAFERDYQQNGPSLYRLIRAVRAGGQQYHDDPDPRIRQRMAAEGRRLKTWGGAALWAVGKYLAGTNPRISQRIR